MKFTRATFKFTLALILALTMLPSSAFAGRTALAAAGALDPTFDADGLVATDFHNTIDDVRDITIQPDGKIVAVGITEIAGPDHNFSVARYNPDGSPDTTFSFDGHLTTSLSAGADGALAVAIQPDGKIVAAGYAAYNTVRVDGLARYNTDGSLDTSFNNDGIVYGDWITSLSGVAIQTDGKIVASGYSPDIPYGFSVFRFNADGSVDQNFGDDGHSYINFFGGQNAANSMLLQPDGKILVAGTAQVNGSNYDLALARFLPDGDLDPTFDTDGKLTTDFFGGDDSAHAAALDPGGRIYLAGAFYTTSRSYDFGLARYNPDGALDPTFDTDGLLDLPLAAGQSQEVALDVLVQPSDGKVVAAGYAPVGGVNNFALVRLLTDGSLDANFGDAGVLTHNFGGGVAIANALAIQTDGKLISGGTAYMGEPNSYDYALARYLDDDSVTPTPTSTSLPNPSVTPTICAIEYTDVPQGSTFYSFVHCLACRGIINGYETGCETGSPCFRPNNNLTRGQLAKIVSNAANYTEDHTNSTFEDVAVGSTFHLFIERLSSRSIINGYPCGGPAEPCGNTNKPYFRPNANVTRGQTSKIVAIARNLSDPNPNQQSFEDVPGTHTFWRWIEALYTIGVINGYPCGGLSEPCNPPNNLPYFRPGNNVTRGQSSKIIGNAFFPTCAQQTIPTR